LRENFPRVEVVICDYYHVAEYLAELARALHPGQEEAARAWRKQWCGRLKAEGGPAVLEGLRALDLRGRPAAAKEKYREVVRYFENQGHRMDYPEYQRRGGGSGGGGRGGAGERGRG